MTSSDERTIRLSRKKILGFSLGAAVFVALGFWLLLLDDAEIRSFSRSGSPLFVHGVGAVSIAFFGAVLVSALGKVFKRNPGLVLNSTGFVDNASAAAAGPIAWSEVADAQVAQVQGQLLLVVRLRNPQACIERGGPIRRALNRLNYKLCGSPVAISANALEIRFSELCSLFDAYRQKYCRT